MFRRFLSGGLTEWLSTKMRVVSSVQNTTAPRMGAIPDAKPLQRVEDGRPLGQVHQPGRRSYLLVHREQRERSHPPDLQSAANVLESKSSRCYVLMQLPEICVSKIVTSFLLVFFNTSTDASLKKG